MQKIIKGDMVTMRSGADRGKTGKVVKVFPREGRLMVDGLNIATKYRRPRRQGEKGQRVQFPRRVHVATVMLLCPTCKKEARVGFRLLADGKKERMCKKCSATIGKGS